MHQQQQMYTLGNHYLNQPVSVQTVDNQTFQGIVEHVDPHYLYLAVPNQSMHREDQETRQFPGYGVPYGYFPPYGYPYSPYPYSPISRLVLPLTALAALALLPGLYY
ncbi:hypothetical protein [Desertibacillus haloalkaliphilus]|uniref:hypothetical protein n=1 Tax=Desertibacillus haloalkaliphilus TaxID=1328930 RepID=UPI001C266A2D|nr:hypothetical protein [Desertibacillus haloalkaliphilus]MBU8905438.1 hypothetical protein [Desertibacillus haloalkaliphilus]